MQINDGKLKFHTLNQRNFQLVNVYIMSNIGSQVKDLKMNRTGNTKKHTQISSKGKSRGRKEEEKIAAEDRGSIPLLQRELYCLIAVVSHTYPVPFICRAVDGGEQEDISKVSLTVFSPQALSQEETKGCVGQAIFCCVQSPEPSAITYRPPIRPLPLPLAHLLEKPPSPLS